MLESVPKVGFQPHPSVTRDQAIEFIQRRVREVKLLIMEPQAAEASGYLPRRTIISGPGSSITKDQAEELLADKETTMPIELVKLPAAFVKRMRYLIPPRGGRPLRNAFQYQPLIRDSQQNVLLQGVPLERRDDAPMSGPTGTVDTAILTSSGVPSKVGWHFDAVDSEGQLEYAVINGHTSREMGTSREFAFTQGLGRIATHEQAAAYIDRRLNIAHRHNVPSVTGFAIRLEPCEALLRVRAHELLHDGLPHALGSISVMVSMDPETPFYQFGPEPWNEGDVNRDRSASRINQLILSSSY